MNDDLVERSIQTYEGKCLELSVDDLKGITEVSEGIVKSNSVVRSCFTYNPLSAILKFVDRFYDNSTYTVVELSCCF